MGDLQGTLNSSIYQLFFSKTKKKYFSFSGEVKDSVIFYFLLHELHNTSPPLVSIESTQTFINVKKFICSTIITRSDRRVKGCVKGMGEWVRTYKYLTSFKLIRRLRRRISLATLPRYGRRDGWMVGLQS